jgi:hypothetical protein
MVLKLAGRDYEHAAGAIFACRSEGCKVVQVEGQGQGNVKVREVCAPLVGGLQGAEGAQAGCT